MGSGRRGKGQPQLYLRVIAAEASEDPARDEPVIRAALAGSPLGSLSERFELHPRGGYAIWIELERDRVAAPGLLRDVVARLECAGFGSSSRRRGKAGAAAEKGSLCRP